MRVFFFSLDNVFLSKTQHTHKKKKKKEIDFDSRCSCVFKLSLFSFFSQLRKATDKNLFALDCTSLTRAALERMGPLMKSPFFFFSPLLH